MKTEAQLRSAVPEDLPAIRALLTAAGLPTDDLERAPVRFVVALSDSQVIGVAGAETLGTRMVLLRSFAVEASRTNRGLGGTLLARVLSDARQRGVTDFYLLTMSAREFFAARGFAPLARDKAPAPVRAHPQYCSLCPASATLMHLHAPEEGA